MKKNIFSQLFPLEQESEFDNEVTNADASPEKNGNSPTSVVTSETATQPTMPQPQLQNENANSPQLKRSNFQMPSNAYTNADGEGEGDTSNVAPLQRDQIDVSQWFPSQGRNVGDETDQTGLATPEPEMTENPKLFSEIDPLSQKRRRVEARQERLANPENRDKGFKATLLEGISNFLYGMGEARRQNPNAKWQEVVAGGGGSLAGGYINRTWNERREDEQGLALAQRDLSMFNGQEKEDLDKQYKQAQIQQTIEKPKIAREQMEAKVQADIQKQKNRIEVINRQADIRSGNAQLFIDGEGKLWKQFLKPDSSGKTREMEPIINPTSGEQEFAPGEQMIEVPDPSNPDRKIQVKAKQWLMPSATLANSDANRKQQADTTNANNEIRVAVENANNQQTYNKQVYDLAIAAQKTAGGNIENQAELEGYSTTNQNLMNELGVLAGKDTSTMTPGEIEKANKRMQELTDQINANNQKFDIALGKTQAGREALTNIQNQKIQRPPILVAPKIKAAQVINTGKTVPKSKDPMGLFQ